MLYRRQRAGAPWWLTAALVVLALVLGLLLGRASAPRPTLSGFLAPSVSALSRASGALDIAALEYARARAGNAQSAQASRAAVARASAALQDASVAAQLSPEAYAAARQALVDLAGAEQARTDAATVRRLAAEGQARLGALADRLRGAR